ncbi:MAG TPA: iron export ABC transporter permease subunit FetB [Hyphomicrobium sp.]|nr:iron export ABC transporter permease subunit FetB [Hyphomicrobium sp.]
MTSYVPLSFSDLAIAAALVLLNGAISFAYRLKLEKSLALASLRMIVQLAAVALVLRFIFLQVAPLWTIAFAAVMATGAILEVVTRQHYRLKHKGRLLLSASPAFLSGLATTLVALAVIQPDPWYAPRFLLPILGMLAGNTLSGVTLVLDTLTSAAERERSAIESRLALGATRMEAFQDILRKAMRTGMTPILNAMAAAGIVSLPGMMTGQILAGIDPLEAAKYQILIMFLIAGATAIAVLTSGLIMVHFITDDRHRLRLDYLTKSTG